MRPPDTHEAEAPAEVEVLEPEEDFKQFLLRLQFKNTAKSSILLRVIHEKREDFASLIARTGGELADEEQAMKTQVEFSEESDLNHLHHPSGNADESVGVGREGQGDPEDGGDAGRARLAKTEKRVFLKEEIR
ncbi:MORF4 family-associated protein 1-like 1, partial [Plecturocebus cupreus]